MRKNILNTNQDVLDKSDPNFWGNQILKLIESAKYQSIQRKGEKDSDIKQDLLNSIQNTAAKAKAYSISSKNKHIFSKSNKNTIKHYKTLESIRKQVEQYCMWIKKKESIKNITNGSLLNILISNPENNIFEYQAKTSKKIYDVIVLRKNNKIGKTDYQLEIVGNKNTVFTVSIDKGQEKSIFKLSKDTSNLESIQEIEKNINQYLNKIF